MKGHGGEGRAGDCADSGLKTYFQEGSVAQGEASESGYLQDLFNQALLLGHTPHLKDVRHIRLGVKASCLLRTLVASSTSARQTTSCKPCQSHFSAAALGQPSGGCPQPGVALRPSQLRAAGAWRNRFEAALAPCIAQPETILQRIEVQPIHS